MIIKDLDFSSEIKRNDLLHALKGEANQLHINDFIKACSFLRKSMEHVHPHYQKEYIKLYIEGYLMSYRDVKNYKTHYNGVVDSGELKEAVNLLNEQEKTMADEFGENIRSFKPFMIMSLYTTFVKEEPVHPVGTPFPGGLKVHKEKEVYYCPVKENNENNPLAVCGFCIAEQEPDL